MKKRSLVLVVVGIVLFTFIAAPPAHAIVPAFAWVIWGIGAAVSSVAVWVDVGKQKEQHEASDQGRQGEELKPEGSDMQVHEG